MTAAAEAVLDRAAEPDRRIFLLCDADLGASARELVALVAAVERRSATSPWRRFAAGWAAASG